METHQSSYSQEDSVNIGLFFWPTLVLIYSALISSAIWFIWG